MTNPISSKQFAIRRQSPYHQYIMKIPSLAAIKDTVLDILFPPLCFACEKNLLPEEKTQNVCAACFGSIALFDTLFCSVCGARLPGNAKICHPEALYMLGSAASYRNEAVQKLIWRLKYGKLRAAAVPLAGLLAQYLTTLDYHFLGFTVLPVPLHADRFEERGFNQAELLATHVAAHLRLPLVTDVLQRVKATPAQAKMRDRAERSANLADAFAINPHSTAIAGKNILLVDDVFTTGATIGEAVRMLKTAGAKIVIALTIARAI
ncbi:MAG: ComF family protein [bacterium]|nr:ComF family protein [bacterium]